jgi:hypothetical protein
VTDPASLGLALAFSAGLLSFVSPCVLPLVPSYLTFVTGVGFDDLATSRRAALVHALLFVLGFTLIFVALGASATLLGRVLIAYRVWITRLGGALVVLFGLYLLGVVRVGAFDRERRVHLANKPLGYLGTVFVGVAFGAGWTPWRDPHLHRGDGRAVAGAPAAAGVLARARDPISACGRRGGALPRDRDALAAASRAGVAGERGAARDRRRHDDAGLLHRAGDVPAVGDACCPAGQAVDRCGGDAPHRSTARAVAEPIRAHFPRSGHGNSSRGRPRPRLLGDWLHDPAHRAGPAGDRR